MHPKLAFLLRYRYGSRGDCPRNRPVRCSFAMDLASGGIGYARTMAGVQAIPIVSQAGSGRPRRKPVVLRPVRRTTNPTKNCAA